MNLCQETFCIVVVNASGGGRVARPFGFALTDPGMRLSRTRLFPGVTHIAPCLSPKDE